MQPGQRRAGQRIEGFAAGAAAVALHTAFAAMAVPVSAGAARAAQLRSGSLVQQTADLPPGVALAQARLKLGALARGQLRQLFQQRCECVRFHDLAPIQGCESSDLRPPAKFHDCCRQRPKKTAGIAACGKKASGRTAQSQRNQSCTIHHVFDVRSIELSRFERFPSAA
jgi:hypothetical protein